MAQSLHPAATHHVPAFITSPGGTDVLMVVAAVVLVVVVLGFGVLFFRLHSLPERIAHKTHRVQLEIVAVLCLIALFTHIHLFWVAALLLALIEFPDIGGWLGRIAGSVEKIAEARQGQGVAEAPAQAHGEISREAAAPAPEEPPARIGATDKPAAAATTPEQPAPASARS
jgi:hypothetical protein